MQLTRVPIGGALILAVATGSVSGCGGSGSSPSTEPTITVAVGEALPPYTGPFADANAAACATDRQTFQTAVDAYTAFNGQPPAAEADLVIEQWLTNESVLFDIDPDGAVVAAPGSPCT